MRQILLLLLIHFTASCYAQPFQLAPPRLIYSSAFFKDSITIRMEFSQPGASIHYTTDGSEPGNNSPVYKEPLVINKNTVLKVISAGAGFLPSETVKASFIKEGIAARQIAYSRPHEVYAQSAPAILMDNKGGMPDFRNGQWLGYTGDTAALTIRLHKKQKVKQVLIDFLQDENSWIFLPEQVLVWYYDDGKKAFIPAGKKTFTHEAAAPRQCVPFTIALDIAVPVDHLKITAIPLQQIPAWHAGKGSRAWLFIDEIKVY